MADSAGQIKTGIFRRRCEPAAGVLAAGEHSHGPQVNKGGSALSDAGSRARGRLEPDEQTIIGCVSRSSELRSGRGVLVVIGATDRRWLTGGSWRRQVDVGASEGIYMPKKPPGSRQQAEESREQAEDSRQNAEQDVSDRGRSSSGIRQARGGTAQKLAEARELRDEYRQALENPAGARHSGGCGGGATAAESARRSVDACMPPPRPKAPEHEGRREMRRTLRIRDVNMLDTH